MKYMVATILTSILLLIPFTTQASDKQKAESIAMKSDAWLERTWMWDVNYEFGMEVVDPEHVSYSNFRLGISRFQEPAVFTAGAFAQVPHVQRPVRLGPQLSHMSTRTSTWAQLSPLLDTGGQFHVLVGAGWQVFGVDFRFRPVQNEWSLSAKIRVPISWIVKAVRK